MSTEIPPCPKCGAKAVAVNLLGIGAGVGCTNGRCDFTIYRPTIEEALALWIQEGKE